MGGQAVKKVRRAVFPVAGFGTRFLPATKSMPKELMPVVDRHLIQYAAEEAVRAGIDTLIFVTGRHKRAIEDHFDSNPELEAALRAKGRHDEADMVKNILPEGAGVTSDLVRAYGASGRSQLSVMRVAGEAISSYGVVVPGDTSGSVAGLVEKPKFADAPSDLASIGRYVLTPDIFEVLRGQGAGAGGEIQLADAIDRQARDGAVEAVTLDGKRFDCGSVAGYLEAIGAEVEARCW